MPIKISAKMKEEVKATLEEYNAILSKAQHEPDTTDLTEYVNKVKFDSFEDLKKEPEYSALEVLTGERDAYQNIMLMCDTNMASSGKNKMLSLNKYVELVVELRLYKNVARRKNVRDIQTAREFGDLSENAEYQIAREQQGKIESHIVELEYVVSNCEIVEPKESYTVGEIGSTVTIMNLKTKQQRTFVLTGCFESDINSVPQKISNESPIGAAVMGKKAGDNAIVVTNRGKDMYKIVSVK